MKSMLFWVLLVWLSPSVAGQNSFIGSWWDNKLVADKVTQSGYSHAGFGGLSMNTSDFKGSIKGHLDMPFDGEWTLIFFVRQYWTEAKANVIIFKVNGQDSLRLNSSDIVDKKVVYRFKGAAIDYSFRFITQVSANGNISISDPYFIKGKGDDFSMEVPDYSGSWYGDIEIKDEQTKANIEIVRTGDFSYLGKVIIFGGYGKGTRITAFEGKIVKQSLKFKEQSRLYDKIIYDPFKTALLEGFINYFINNKLRASGGYISNDNGFNNISLVKLETEELSNFAKKIVDPLSLLLVPAKNAFYDSLDPLPVNKYVGLGKFALIVNNVVNPSKVAKFYNYFGMPTEDIIGWLSDNKEMEINEGFICGKGKFFASIRQPDGSYADVTFDGFFKDGLANGLCKFDAENLRGRNFSRYGNWSSGVFEGEAFAHALAKELTIRYDFKQDFNIGKIDKIFANPIQAAIIKDPIDQYNFTNFIIKMEVSIITENKELLVFIKIRRSDFTSPLYVEIEDMNSIAKSLWKERDDATELLKIILKIINVKANSYVPAYEYDDKLKMIVDRCKNQIEKKAPPNPMIGVWSEARTGNILLIRENHRLLIIPTTYEKIMAEFGFEYDDSNEWRVFKDGNGDEYFEVGKPNNPFKAVNTILEKSSDRILLEKEGQKIELLRIK